MICLSKVNEKQSYGSDLRVKLVDNFIDFSIVKIKFNTGYT